LAELLELHERDVAGFVAGDEHPVDDGDGPAGRQALELGDDLPVELVVGKTQHQDFDWSERHVPPPGGIWPGPVEVVLTTYRRVLPTLTAKHCAGPPGAMLRLTAAQCRPPLAAATT